MAALIDRHHSMPSAGQMDRHAVPQPGVGGEAVHEQARRLRRLDGIPVDGVDAGGVEVPPLVARFDRAFGVHDASALMRSISSSISTLRSVGRAQRRVPRTAWANASTIAR